MLISPGDRSKTKMESPTETAIREELEGLTIRCLNGSKELLRCLSRIKQIMDLLTNPSPRLNSPISLKGKEDKPNPIKLPTHRILVLWRGLSETESDLSKQLECTPTLLLREMIIKSSLLGVEIHRRLVDKNRALRCRIEAAKEEFLDQRFEEESLMEAQMKEYEDQTEILYLREMAASEMESQLYEDEREIDLAIKAFKDDIQSPRHAKKEKVRLGKSPHPYNTRRSKSNSGAPQLTHFHQDSK